jgi:aminoglycoside/choline kinase family phosphotransferase
VTADRAALEQRRIQQFLTDSALVPANHEIVALTGDASTRRYFRVQSPSNHSIVLALHDGAIEYETLPFIEVGDLLRRMPLPVPAVLGYSDPLGILALQDLGDMTLQALVGTGTIGCYKDLYHQAVEFVIQLQQRGAELASGSSTPYRIAFDVEKLTWEMDFFVKHFLEGYRHAFLTPAEKTALSAEWQVIVGELAAEPRVLCHRDYHSRNLMVHDGRLFIIDFQDARMGPNTYDLVSLLRDSYVEVTEVELDDLIDHFLARAGDARPAEFRHRFDLMAVQRNLKALGTFGNQASARGNPVYVQYIPRTLGYVRTNLAKYARFARLRDLLAAHLPELA